MKKIFIVFIILLLSGCYNYRELNTLDIASSIGIDKKDDLYNVSIQVLNGKQSENTEDSQIVVYSATGKTINEALRNIYKKTSRDLYRGHINNLILSEDVAKESITNTLDMFQRFTDIRDELSIIIVKNETAKKTLKILTTEELVPSEYLKLSLENTDKKTGSTSSTQLDEFTANTLKKYIDPVIATIKIDNYKKKGNTIDNITTSDPTTKIIIDNIGITYKGKLEDYLNKSETIGYNFVTNKINNILVPVKCDNNKYSSINIVSNKTKRKIKKVNNSYIITLNINSNGNITEYNCNNDLDKNNNIKKIEKDTENKIKYYINKSIEKEKNSNSEFLGLKRMIYLEDKNYNNENFKVKVKVNVNLKRKGEIKNTSRRIDYE